MDLCWVGGRGKSDLGLEPEVHDRRGFSIRNVGGKTGWAS